MIRSLAPVWDRRARVLILGSMPGAESLRQQQYYAHPRNAFWPLIEALIGVRAEQPYAQRLEQLRERGIAVWDVLAACQRRGSLDSRIDHASEVPNPVIELLQAFDEPRAVLLNGRKAEASFYRFLAPAVRHYWPTLAIHVLPSTSPAHAALSRVDKQAAWSRMLTYLDKPRKEASAMAKKKTAAKKAKPAKPAKAAKKAATTSRKPVAKKAPAKKKITKSANAGKTKATKTAPPATKPTAKKISAAARKPLAKKKPATKAKTVAKASARMPAKSKKKVAGAPGKAAAPAQAPRRNQAPPRPGVPAKPKPVTQAAKPPKPPKPPRPPKAPPKPKPPRRPRKPTIVAGELVEVSLFKQPLRVPEPWQFGGIAPHEHLHDHGVKAQPDAERLAGKSRKVH